MFHGENTAPSTGTQKGKANDEPEEDAVYDAFHYCGVILLRMKEEERGVLDVCVCHNYLMPLVVLVVVMGDRWRQSLAFGGLNSGGPNFCPVAILEFKEALLSSAVDAAS